MDEVLLPYDLPSPVLDRVVELADHTDVLLFGEVHGTQEVPRVALSVLDLLSADGYGALALEMPYHESDHVVAYATGVQPSPPRFFSHPTPDGRGNQQTLQLIQRAIQRGWFVLCFDQGLGQGGREWRDRDAWMAQNLLDQRKTICAGAKVLGICGDLHARVEAREGENPDFWPSFAASLSHMSPGLKVASVGIVAHRGAYYNMGTRTIQPRPDPKCEVPEFRSSEWRGHTAELHIPWATPATFIRKPVAPS